MLPALLLAGWLVALLLGLSEGNDWGWASPRVLGLFALAVLLAAAWVAVELRVPVPLIDMEMMRLRGVWTANVVAGCVGFSMFASFGFLPQLLQTPREAGYGFGASITESGYLLLPSAVASFLVGFTTSSLIRRLGARAVITTGLLVSGASFVAIGALARPHLAAVRRHDGPGRSARGWSSPASPAWSSPPCPREQTGVASGMNANIRTIGGSMGAAVMAGIITAKIGADGYPAESGYTIGFLVLGVVMALAVAGRAAHAGHPPADHRRRAGRRRRRRARAGPGRRRGASARVTPPGPPR